MTGEDKKRLLTDLRELESNYLEALKSTRSIIEIIESFEVSNNNG